MKRILTMWYAKPLAVYLAVALTALSIFAAPAEAMFLPTVPTQDAPGFDRASDVAMIQQALESRTLQQRLMDYGLNRDEALAKIKGLSDEQIHSLAENIGALQAGGHHMHAETLLIILLLVLLIVILVQNEPAGQSDLS
jgi:hypothetical protein